MGKDKGPPDGPQLFPPSLKTLKRSPIWPQQQEAIAKLRESVPRPQYTPEQLRTPRLPADPAVDAIAARARAEARQELEPEQVPAQQEIEQPTEQTTAQVSEQAAAEKPVAETPAPPEAAPIERIDTKVWWGRWTKANPRRKGEMGRAYAQRAYKDMKKASVTRMWTEEGCRRELYSRPQDPGLADPASVQTFPKRS